MTTPLIIVVGADKGGVGKTQLARLLCNYVQAPDFTGCPPPRVLDGQFPRGDLTQFQPGAQVINIADVTGQMTIFDTLEGISIVDVPAGQLGVTLRACDDAQLFDDVKRGALHMALLHVLGPSISSLDEVQDAVAMLGTSAKHFIVKNHINETNYFEWDESSRYAASLRALADVTIDIPHLNTTANEAVQQARMSFLDFASSPVDREGRPISRTLRGHVVKWAGKGFAEFDRVGLGGMIRETFPKTP